MWKALFIQDTCCMLQFICCWGNVKFQNLHTRVPCEGNGLDITQCQMKHCTSRRLCTAVSRGRSVQHFSTKTKNSCKLRTLLQYSAFTIHMFCINVIFGHPSLVSVVRHLNSLRSNLFFAQNWSFQKPVVRLGRLSFQSSLEKKILFAQMSSVQNKNTG